MNISNNLFIKPVVLIIAFVCPFLSVSATAHILSAQISKDNLVIPVIMQCVIVLLWLLSNYFSVSSGMTKQPVFRRILLSGNFFIAVIFSLWFNKIIFDLTFSPYVFLPPASSWCAVIYIKRNKVTFNIVNAIATMCLIVIPWLLFLAAFNFMFSLSLFLDKIPNKATNIYSAFAFLYIIAFFLAVKRNINLYAYGILTINQIPIWISLIMGVFFLSAGYITGSAVFLILIALILYVPMLFMYFMTDIKIQKIVNTIFSTDYSCYGKNRATLSGFNSATNIAQVSRSNNGKCFLFNPETGTFLIIALNENKIIGFDYHQFAAVEISGSNNCSMTLQFHDPNNPYFSISSGSVPEFEQYLNAASPVNPASGFRQHVQRAINEKFPHHKWQLA